MLGMLLFTSAAAAEDAPPPSMALLEFLGEWGDTDPGQFAQELNGAAVLAGATDEKPEVQSPRGQSSEESKDDE